jgi:hypothetical protein
MSLPTYGSKLMYSTDGTNFTTVAQLRKVTPEGSKQTIVDQTNILTSGNGDAPLAVRFSAGEISLDGVLSPQSTSQLAMGTLHANLSLVYWKLLLADNLTVWTWSGFVSEFVPWALDVSKSVPFSAKIRVWGGLTGPAGGSGFELESGGGAVLLEDGGTLLQET